MTKVSLGIIIPTYQAGPDLLKCLSPLAHSPLRPKILVVDSSSTDETVEIARSLNSETLIIPKKEFHHGRTREKARLHLGTDYVMFLTQDAYLVHPDMIERLIAPLVSGKASAVYGRQIPHEGASTLSSFGRSFNYPNQSYLRGIEDEVAEGVGTFFFSHSFAAYKNSALDEIGGIPDFDFGEDTAAIAMLLKKGKKVAYAADAVVKHSHNYTLKQEFKRHIEIGKMRARLSAFFETKQGDKKRGQKYAQELGKTLLKEKPLLIPYATLHLAAKWLGYQYGFMTSTQFKVNEIKD